MTFVLSKLFWMLARPDSLLLILLAIGVVLLWSRWRAWGRGLVTTVLVALVAVAVLPVADWLASPLEERFEAPRTLPERIDGVVLLGGASDPKMMEARGQPAVDAAAERLFGFVELARRYPEARLAYAGGTGALFPGSLREADVGRRIFSGLGLDLTRVTFEEKSRNTFENVHNLRALLRPTEGEVWLLVTSAWHMPRSVGVFRKADWAVVPFPVDYVSSGALVGGPGFGLADHLSTLGLAAKEWVGLVAYYAMGRTSALFPGPATGPS